MAKLVVFRSRVREAVFDLRASSCLVGRARRCQLQLDDRLISRRHAWFTEIEAGRWQVADLRTANGLFVNDDRVTTAELSSGDVVTLGQHVLVFREENLTSTESVAAVAHIKRWQGPGTESTHRLPQVKIEDLLVRAQLRLRTHVVILGKEPIAIPLEDPNQLVGYGKDCDIVLPGDKWFARKAFHLTMDAQESWFATALSPLVPIRVNGMRVEQQVLAEGDVISVRGCSIRFHTALADQ